MKPPRPILSIKTTPKHEHEAKRLIALVDKAKARKLEGAG